MYLIFRFGAKSSGSGSCCSGSGTSGRVILGSCRTEGEGGPRLLEAYVRIYGISEMGRWDADAGKDDASLG